jgi:hypothetical protein
MLIKKIVKISLPYHMEQRDMEVRPRGLVVVAVGEKPFRPSRRDLDFI